MLPVNQWRSLKERKKWSRRFMTRADPRNDGTAETELSSSVPLFFFKAVRPFTLWLRILHVHISLFVWSRT